MARFAVVNPDNIVANIIVWDEASDWRPPEGHIIVKVEEIRCDIGWHHKDGVFSNPNEEAPQE